MNHKVGFAHSRVSVHTIKQKHQHLKSMDSMIQWNRIKTTTKTKSLRFFRNGPHSLLILHDNVENHC